MAQDVHASPSRAIVGLSPAINSGVTVMAPLFHGSPHGQKLVFKLGASVAGHQVQLQCNVVRQAERAILTRNQQCGGLPAGTS